MYTTLIFSIIKHPDRKVVTSLPASYPQVFRLSAVHADESIIVRDPLLWQELLVFVAREDLLPPAAAGEGSEFVQ